MPDLSSTVSSALSGYYAMIRTRVHALVDPLSSAQIWDRPYPYGNSIGHLLLHMTGNLNYYIGAQVAGTGYVRDRDREFAENARPSKDQVLEAFDRAIDMVIATVKTQSVEDWSASYSAEREPEAKDRFTVFLRCAATATITLHRSSTCGRS